MESQPALFIAIIGLVQPLAMAVFFILSGLIFHAGLAISRAPEHSLHKNRERVVEALDKKDYRILGERPKGHY